MARNELIEKTLADAMDLCPHLPPYRKVATYIPELAREIQTGWGPASSPPDGEVYPAGDWRQEFTIQSISKTITLIMALQTAGYDKVFSKVGWSRPAMRSIRWCGWKQKTRIRSTP